MRTRTNTHTHTFRHTAGVSFSHQNKDTSSYKHLSGNEWLWSAVEKLHLTICSFTLYYFTYLWLNTFTVKFPSFVTLQFLLFIKSQFTTVARNILHLTQSSHGHVWLITDCCTLSEVAESCEWFGIHQKRVAEVSAHLQLVLNVLGLLSVRTHQSLMDWD
jgi:hypothetical protein